MRLGPEPVALSRRRSCVGALLSGSCRSSSSSGGPAAYWHALFDQGAEDLGNIQMLWTTHGARDVRDALYYAFVAPWAAWPVAAVVADAARRSASCGCCARGAAALVAARGRVRPVPRVRSRCSRKRSRAATRCRWSCRWRISRSPGCALLPWDIGPGGRGRAGDVRRARRRHVDRRVRAREGAGVPAARRHARRGAGRDAAAGARDGSARVVRSAPADHVGGRRDAAPSRATLPAPPQHEWLEAVKYWNGGGRAPVWFVVDPMRAQHRSRRSTASRCAYRWPLPYPVLLERRPAERDGLVPRRSARVVRRRRLGADAGGRRRRRRGSPRTGARADRRLDSTAASLGGDADDRRPQPRRRRRGPRLTVSHRRTSRRWTRR